MIFRKAPVHHFASFLCPGTFSTIGAVTTYNNDLRR